MAELALLASIVQIADIGLRLSTRLYVFGDTVASADKSILAISKDVELTSYVLQHLGRTFEDDKGCIHTDRATHTAEAVAQECSNVFQEMDALLLRKMPQLRAGNTDKKTRAKTILERLKWPAIKGKIEILNLNLDRLKSTLTLMLEVINYAQQVARRNEPAPAMAEQRQLIEALAQFKEERERLYEQAQRGLEGLSLNADAEKAAVPDRSARMTLMAMPQHDLPNQQHNQETGEDTSLLSQTSTLTDAKENPVHIDQLLDEYTRLQKALIEEVHSEQYKIQQASRTRLQDHIDNAHRSEVRCIRESKTWLAQNDNPLQQKVVGQEQGVRSSVPDLASRYKRTPTVESLAAQQALAQQPEPSKAQGSNYDPKLPGAFTALQPHFLAGRDSMSRFAMRKKYEPPANGDGLTWGEGLSFEEKAKAAAQIAFDEGSDLDDFESDEHFGTTALNKHSTVSSGDVVETPVEAECSLQYASEKASWPSMHEEGVETSEMAASPSKEGSQASNENQREAKPDGPFSGLEACIVVSGGMVEDNDGNTVGQVTDGRPETLVGRAVDEDGDILDKYGNVLGHAERYEELEMEIADLSVLEDKTVAESGMIIDEHSEYGRIVEGNLKELVGRKVDGQGQVWNDNGKVIGQAELVNEEDRQVAERERAERDAKAEEIAKGTVSKIGGKVRSDKGLEDETSLNDFDFESYIQPTADVVDKVTWSGSQFAQSQEQWQTEPESQKRRERVFSRRKHEVTEEKINRSRKRRRSPPAKQFMDVEAEVDDEEENETSLYGSTPTRNAKAPDTSYPNDQVSVKRARSTMAVRESRGKPLGEKESMLHNTETSERGLQEAERRRNFHEKRYKRHSGADSAENVKPLPIVEAENSSEWLEDDMNMELDLDLDLGQDDHKVDLTRPGGVMPEREEQSSTEVGYFEEDVAGDEAMPRSQSSKVTLEEVPEARQSEVERERRPYSGLANMPDSIGVDETDAPKSPVADFIERGRKPYIAQTGKGPTCEAELLVSGSAFTTPATRLDELLSEWTKVDA